MKTALGMYREQTLEKFVHKVHCGNKASALILLILITALKAFRDLNECTKLIMKPVLSYTSILQLPT